ncbi:MAG TPA: hypothetical protein PKD80_17850 [Microthrixaceae bacterium]|nr:hypothetical protein [Microthrixaceae bacterium]HMT60694.1 hypothetical protein [Microthrixaceae bacterium]
MTTPAMYDRAQRRIAPLANRLRVPAAAMFVAIAAPLRRVMAIHQGFGIRAAALVAVSALWCFAQRRFARGDRWRTVALSAGAAALAAGAGGRHVGVWVFVSSIIAASTFLDAELPLIGRYTPGPRLVIMFAATWSAALAANRVGAALVATAIQLACIPLFARRSTVDRRLARGASAALSAVSSGARAAVRATLIAPLWVIAVLIPWLAGRVTRFDALRPAGHVRAWIQLNESMLEHPERMWFTDPAAHPAPLSRRMHMRLTAVVGAVMIVAVAGVPIGIAKRSEQPSNAALETLRRPSWFPALEAANDDAVRHIWFSQYAGNEWRDESSPHLNISASRRRTWRDRSCEGEPIRVWMFGGSTLFGVYQRDAHTIPSEVAREASKRGLALDVQNWGMVGDVAWQQNRRLERALASETPPDIVVYYDGWNDLRAVVDMDFTGRSGPADFVGPMDRTQERMLSDMGGFSVAGWQPVRTPSPRRTLRDAAAVDLAARSYRAADGTARLLTDDAGVDFLHLYQPSLLTRATIRAGEPAVDPPARALVSAFRERLPRSIIDLGSALDRSGGLAFYDETHTLESANLAIAAAILDELEPRLASLRDRSARGVCR